MVGYKDFSITYITLKLEKWMIVGDHANTLWWPLFVVENIVSRNFMFQSIPKTMKLIELRKQTKVCLMILTVLN